MAPTHARPHDKGEPRKKHSNYGLKGQPQDTRSQPDREGTTESAVQGAGTAGRRRSQRRQKVHRRRQAGAAGSRASVGRARLGPQTAGKAKTLVLGPGGACTKRKARPADACCRTRSNAPSHARNDRWGRQQGESEPRRQTVAGALHVPAGEGRADGGEAAGGGGAQAVSWRQ